MSRKITLRMSDETYLDLKTVGKCVGIKYIEVIREAILEKIDKEASNIRDEIWDFYLKEVKEEEKKDATEV